MTAKPQVLVVGITGMMGEKIAHAILDKGAMEVRALLRSGSANDLKKREKLDALQVKGVYFGEGDVNDFDSLVAASQGVYVTISAVKATRN